MAQVYILTEIRRSDKAICVSQELGPGDKGYKTHWLPFSQIEITGEWVSQKSGEDMVSLEIPDWLATKKGIA